MTPTGPLADEAGRAGDGAAAAARIIFLSDFGNTDEFVGVVHAVLHHHAPDAVRIDLTHGIAAHDVRAGALTLWRAAPWVAPAVILAVVDPGVGTGRRAVAVEVAEAATVLVGPDNGLLLPAALRLGRINAAVELPSDPVSPGATFQGRDVFAPAAGRLAAGAPLHELGAPIDPAGLVGGPLPAPTFTADGRIETEVLWVDHFGNAQLGITAAQAGPGPLVMRAGGSPAVFLRIVPSYGAITPDQFALVIDSYGHLSVCSDQGSAADHLGLRAADRVSLAPRDSGLQAHRPR